MSKIIHVHSDKTTTRPLRTLTRGVRCALAGRGWGVTSLASVYAGLTISSIVTSKSCDSSHGLSLLVQKTIADE